MTSFASRFTLLSALALLAVAPAAHAQQKLVPAQSSLSFVIKQMGVPVEGQFKTFDAQVAFDPAKLASSRIGFTVEMGPSPWPRLAPHPTWPPPPPGHLPFRAWRSRWAKPSGLTRPWWPTRFR